MTTPQNLQIHPTSTQQPHLLPHLAYQTLPEQPSSPDTVLQPNLSENLPNNQDSGEPNIQPSDQPNIERCHDAEAEFENSFDRFFKKFCSHQGFTLIFFFILNLQVLDPTSGAAALFIGFTVLYLAHLRVEWYTTEIRIEKLLLRYKMFEFLGVWMLLVMGFYKFVFFWYIPLSYLAKTLIGYFYNTSLLVRLTNQVNKAVLAVRICILIQGVFFVIPEIMDITIPHGMLFTPFYAIILVISFFTVKLIKNIYFTYRLQFWSIDADEKKAGVKWILGNLFGLLGILFAQGYILNFLDMIWGDLEVLVCVGIVMWCAISLRFRNTHRDAVFMVCEDLAIILQMNKNYTPIADDTLEKIKYVTRISNTYFKPSTTQEINNGVGNEEMKSIEMSNEVDLEAGAENNAEAEDRSKCIVCCTKSANAVFMECGHGGICFKCGKEINNSSKECHMCRQKIKAVFKMNIKENNKENVYGIVKRIQNPERELRWENVDF